MGIGLQIVVCALLLKLPIFRQVFLTLNQLILSLEKSTAAGTSFVFGYLGAVGFLLKPNFPMPHLS